MIHKISHRHFCDLGALSNPRCFTRVNNDKTISYYYNGNLSEACWMGYNAKSPSETNDLIVK